MTTLILEDEPLAADRIRVLLNTYDKTIVVKMVLDNVDDAVNWIKTNPPVDFILADIQLCDGSAFQIFKQIPVAVPVIFTTAFDQFALDAFNFLSIDYLLKPVTYQALSKALDKFKKLVYGNLHSDFTYRQLAELMSGKQNYKSRFTGKSGSKTYFIDISEIEFFSADNKIVFLFRTDGNRFVIDYNLEQLNTLLDPKLFFRINRSNIVSIKAILHIKPYLNSRLKIILKSGACPDDLIISRERVNSFIEWANR